METLVSVFENIWLAEDDIDDQLLLEEAIKQTLPSAKLIIISTGEELINQLEKSITVPDMLFLDINMPCKNGLDCLLKIRANGRFRKLPIIVFTSLVQPKDITISYGYGENLYFSKPSSFQKLIKSLNNLFKMNWEHPSTITNEHCINNKFIPYNTSLF